MQLVEAIDDPGLQNEAVERLGLIKAERGQFDLARGIADEMAHPEFVLAAVAVKQAADGDNASADTTLDGIAFPTARVTARLGIADAAIKGGDMERAIATLEKATEDALEIEHQEEKVRSLIEIGNLFLDAERKDKAISTFDSAREQTEVLDNMHRDGFFASASVGFLRAGSQDLSDRTLDLVADKTQLSNALFGHARYFWQNDQKDDAIEALDEAYEVLRSQKDIETRNSRDRNILFASLAAQFAGFGKGERAIEIAEKIEDHEHSMTALSQVARVLTVAGNEELARNAVDAIPDVGQQVFAFIGMSDEYAKSDKEKAVSLINEAAENIESIPQFSVRSSALNTIADRAATLGLDDLLDSSVQQQFQTIEEMKSKSAQAQALASLSTLTEKHELMLGEPEHERLKTIVSQGG
jgi:tetratricopeptide (TPR) repeat protein